MRLARVAYDSRQMVAFSSSAGPWTIPDPAGPNSQFHGVQTIIAGAGETRLAEAPALADQVPEQELKFLAPLINPGKIICVGRNYADHAREMGGEPAELPVIFSKFASSVIGPGEPICLPQISEQVDYEAELVVVIGKPGRLISRETAMQHVFGYTIGNDVSARDWQKGRPGGQWLLGKTFDTFAPLGPWIVAADAISDPHQLDIELRLNGQTMQQANTRDLIFRIDFLIEHVSKFFTLRSGDLIFTGTPAGVGASRQPPVFLQDGDSIEISIEGIGRLCNSVAAANQQGT